MKKIKKLSQKRKTIGCHKSADHRHASVNISCDIKLREEMLSNYLYIRSGPVNFIPFKIWCKL